MFNPLPFHIPFWQKRYLFYIPFIDKRYPFHIPTLGSLFLIFMQCLINKDTVILKGRPDLFEIF